MTFNKTKYEKYLLYLATKLQVVYLLSDELFFFGGGES